MDKALYDKGMAMRRRVLADDAMARLERMMEMRGFEERLNALFATGAIHGTNPGR